MLINVDEVTPLMDTAVWCPSSAAPEITGVHSSLGMRTKQLVASDTEYRKRSVCGNTLGKSASFVGPDRIGGTEDARVRSGPWTRTLAV